MGTGYVVLDISQKGDKQFQPLHHRISWREDDKESFRAAWDNMPMWCRYCHHEGHTKFNCSDAKARILCYACHEKGHRSFECPKKTTSESITTKKIRKSYRTRVTPQLTQSQNREVSDDGSESDPFDQDYEPSVKSDAGSTVSMEEAGEQSSTVETVELSELRVDHHEIFRLQKDLDGYDSDQLQQVIKELQEAKEIAPSNGDNGMDGDTGTIDIKSWTLIQPTARAIAFKEWCENGKFNHLALSNSITDRRPSNWTLGEYISSPTNKSIL
jgi:hypothetical protein